MKSILFCFVAAAAFLASHIAAQTENPPNPGFPPCDICGEGLGLVPLNPDGVVDFSAFGFGVFECDVLYQSALDGFLDPSFCGFLSGQAQAVCQCGEPVATDAPTPAPVTPAPVTPAPVTPAPVTPDTPAPVTPAPVTPDTPAPVTPAPVTPAPVTPDTPAPVTPAPVAPDTPAPVTPAPVTPAPVTPAPVTPDTPAPVTPAPVTPDTPAPVTPAPVTLAPVVVPTPSPVTLTPTAGSPVTYPVCSICGDGFEVSMPDVTIQFGDGAVETCERIQLGGLLGLIPPDRCTQLPDVIGDACGCIESPTTDSPVAPVTMEPVAAPVAPPTTPAPVTPVATPPTPQPVDDFVCLACGSEFVASLPDAMVAFDLLEDPVSCAQIQAGVLNDVLNEAQCDSISEVLTEVCGCVPSDTTAPTDSPSVSFSPTVDNSIPAELANRRAFEFLTVALEVADLVGTLGGEGPFTLLAPTDKAFQATFGGINGIETALEDVDTLRDILLYHVIPGEIRRSDFVEQEYMSALGVPLDFFFVGTDFVFNDMAEIVGFNLPAGNGVIHAIDRVLIPPVDTMVTSSPVAAPVTPAPVTSAPVAVSPSAPSVSEWLANQNAFQTLTAALVATGLSDVLNSSAEESGAPFTLFAPTERAFVRSLGPGGVEAALEDLDSLREILLYHVVAGTKITKGDIVEGSVTSAQGTDIAITFEDGDVILNGDATVKHFNIHVSNGVIHVIDRVLLL